MFKRSYFLVFSLILTLALMLPMMSMGTTLAQGDPTATPAPTATPIVAEMGTGATHISFWNGLTGSDGVTLNEMLAQYAAENPDISHHHRDHPLGHPLHEIAGRLRSE